MNVSSQSLRRRLSSSTLNRPIRRAPAFKKRSRSSLDLSSSAAPADSNNDDGTSAKPTKRGNARQPTRNNALKGVVACLSGQTADVKDRIHAAIAQLGGSTMGTFDPRYVTHLILDAPAGSKYDSWKAHLAQRAQWAEKLTVVTSAWALACEREGRRVAEGGHTLPEDGVGEPNIKNGAISGHTTTQQLRPSLPKEIQHASLTEKCDWMIEHQPADKYCNLFSRQSFILVGFDDDNDDNGNAGADQEAPAVDSSRLPASGKDRQDNGILEKEYETLKGKISKLIRRAGGTIYWEPNETISIVLLNDDHSKHAWEDVRYFCREHPRGPICVTVDWILTSIYHQTILDTPPFPPEPRVQPLKRKARGSAGSVCSNNAASITSNAKSNKKPKQSASSVFRGDVFAIVPVKSLPGTLDFGREEMETSIVKNGGLLLSKSLLLAAKKDAMSANADAERKYFAVSSRWVQLDCATSYPLLGELSKLGIKVVPVSPVWVAACLENNYKYDPEEYSTLFQPQIWPLRLLESSLSKGKTNFSISVTGFVDSSRYGVKAMLKEIGADFTESLTRRNTHLICKEKKGAKYAKALEWGMHAVSIEWLYHIIRYGYEEGSEDRFSLSTKMETDERNELEHPAAASAYEPDQSCSNGAAASIKAEPGKDLKSCANGANGCQSKSTSDGADAKGQRDTETSASSICHRGKREPPQSSPKDGDPPQSSPTGDTGKRQLQFAAPPKGETTNAHRPSPRRRGKRDRTPLKMSQESTALLSQRSEEDSPEMETQFTVGTIYANADITGGMALPKRQFTSDDKSEEVPLSQVHDAEENGESQVLWFAAPRG